jgi:hypothetical protein
MAVMTCPPGVAALFGLVKSRRGANEIQRPIGRQIKEREEPASGARIGQW